MIYKGGVIRTGLHWRMRLVEKEADRIWQEHGQECVMTSGLDGTHSTWSWHYYGCAVDLRTRYFSQEEAAAVAAALSAALRTHDIRYQVVLHPDSHIHVEYDNG